LLGRSADRGLGAAHHDRALDQDRVRYHQPYQIVFRQLAILEAELGIKRLASTDQRSRLDPKLLQDRLQLGR